MAPAPRQSKLSAPESEPDYIRPSSCAFGEPGACDVCAKRL